MYAIWQDTGTDAERKRIFGAQTLRHVYDVPDWIWDWNFDQLIQHSHDATIRLCHATMQIDGARLLSWRYASIRSQHRCDKVVTCGILWKTVGGK